jgi:hypothetical protein
VDLMNNNQYREAVRLLKPQYVYNIYVWRPLTQYCPPDI